jgi:arginyl-tRNA synthetase
MIKEEKTMQEVTIKNKYCDDCGTQIKKSIMACSVANCEMCGKNLCEKCIEHEESDMGDYRTVYCYGCWTIGEQYRNEIKLLENKIEKLNDKWLMKCNYKI